MRYAASLVKISLGALGAIDMKITSKLGFGVFLSVAGMCLMTTAMIFSADLSWYKYVFLIVAVIMQLFALVFMLGKKC